VCWGFFIAFFQKANTIVVRPTGLPTLTHGEMPSTG
jgi:hypothetical protein